MVVDEPEVGAADTTKGNHQSLVAKIWGSMWSKIVTFTVTKSLFMADAGAKPAAAGLDDDEAGSEEEEEEDEQKEALARWLPLVITEFVTQRITTHRQTLSLSACNSRPTMRKWVAKSCAS
jgi:hypothetical protein